MAETRVAFFPARVPIEAYGNGGFRFAGMSHRGGLLALPSGIRAWDAHDADELSSALLAPVVAEADAIELLLLGTGPSLRLPPRAAREALEGAGIAFETMATGAACRTFNVLFAEGRAVAAAFLPVP